MCQDSYHFVHVNILILKYIDTHYVWDACGVTSKFLEVSRYSDVQGKAKKCI